MGEPGVEVMRCKGLGNKMTWESAVEMGKLLKRYEIKKLRSYISIIKQTGDTLRLANLRQLQKDFSGNVLVCDGESISLLRL